MSNRSGLSKFEICGTRENSIRKSVIAAHDVQALARCCSPRADVTVCTPYGLSDLAAALFGNRSCQASVQPGRRELRSEGINGRRSHSFARAEYSIRTSVLPPAGRETAAVRIGKSERARRIRNLWNHGKFDLKIADCRERRTSSCAALFSPGGGYRLYAVQIIEPSLCDFRKQRFIPVSSYPSANSGVLRAAIPKPIFSR